MTLHRGPPVNVPTHCIMSCIISTTILYLFKSIFMFEKYLKRVSNPSDRSNLTRFRTSSHKLRVEYGRYTVPKTPITERLCTQCSLNAVEDEGHFLMICPKYVAQRARITKHLNSNKNIASQTHMSKFNWLLSNQDPLICKDYYILPVLLLNVLPFGHSL